MSVKAQTPPPPRVVDATLYRNQVSEGPIEIVGSTKHGSTLLLAVAAEGVVEAGDSIKAKKFVLNAREFKVVRRHEKPMKIAGAWYEVTAVAAPAPVAKAKSPIKPVAKAKSPVKPARR